MMKKIFSIAVLISSFSIFNSAHAQSSVTAGPEQKIKAEMKVPSAVRPGSTFTVEIKITKGSISGLGRFQQYLPKGMTAVPVENAGADFSFENQNLKFIWVAFPQNEVLDLKYRITVDATLNTAKTLSGTFSYVENGRTKTFSIPPKEINIDAKAPEEEVTASAPEPPKGEAAPVVMETKPEITEVPIPFTPIGAETKPQEEKPAAEPEPVTKTMTVEVPSSAKPKSEEKPVGEVTEKKEPVAPSLNMPAAESQGVIFRVQIAAMNEKRFRKDGHFQKKFGIEQTVYTEEHDGLKKYSVGNFITYNEARKLRDEISANANGCFVVAYRDGARISVAEAIALLKK